jgi:hypothetical protein
MDDRKRAIDLWRGAAGDPPAGCAQLVDALVSQSVLLRHVAAVALANLSPEQLPESSIRELLSTLARLEYLERPAIAAAYAEVTAMEDDSHDLGQDIVVALAALRCGQADFAIPRLLEFWSFDSQFYELAHALLALAFPLTEVRVVKDSLTGVQYRILQALVATGTIWASDATWPACLTARGLPASRAGVFQLLGYRAD